MMAVDSLRTERGSIIAFVAVGLPVLLTVFTIAIDVGNFFVHKRVLQNQADAAALAGGDLFADCFNGQGSAPMIAEANKYDGGTYNPQYAPVSGDTESFAYNSDVYPSGAGSDNVTSDPCSSSDPTPYSLDVKGSEENLPWLFGNLIPGLSRLAHIEAHARVSLLQETIFGGLLPLAVPSPAPNYVFASFVDETTGNAPTGCASPCQLQLTQSSTSGGIQYWAPAAGAALTFPIPANLGVRVRLVGGTDPTAACGTPLVNCYPLDGGDNNGLVYIRGWNGSATAPDAHNVWMLGGTCVASAGTPDAYFTSSASCSAGVSAELDLAGNPAASGVTAAVTASVDGNGSYALTPGALVSGTTSTYTWTALSGLPLTTTGPHNISLKWTWKQTSGSWRGNPCTNPSPCTGSGSFGTATAGVQRAFVADSGALSGPIQQVQVGELNGSNFGANSFKAGETHSLFVTVGTTGTLQVEAQANDPVYSLKVAGNQGQSVQCDPSPNQQLESEIENGCSSTFQVNTGTDCPSNATALFNTTQPYDCVAVSTGNSRGQISQGWDFRILGSTHPGSCTVPNTWPNWSASPTRIVNLFLTPFDSFNGSGADITYPVIGAATFYITGWDQDPCSTTPSGGLPGDDPADKFTVVGHFIKYVAVNDQHVHGSGPCNGSSLAPCIAVLTR